MQFCSWKSKHTWKNTDVHFYLLCFIVSNPMKQMAFTFLKPTGCMDPDSFCYFVLAASFHHSFLIQINSTGRVQKVTQLCGYRSFQCCVYRKHCIYVKTKGIVSGFLFCSTFLLLRSNLYPALPPKHFFTLSETSILMHTITPFPLFSQHHPPFSWPRSQINISTMTKQRDGNRKNTNYSHKNISTL